MAFFPNFQVIYRQNDVIFVYKHWQTHGQCERKLKGARPLIRNVLIDQWPASHVCSLRPPWGENITIRVLNPAVWDLRTAVDARSIQRIPETCDLGLRLWSALYPLATHRTHRMLSFVIMPHGSRRSSRMA